MLNVNSYEKNFQQQAKSFTVDEIGENIEYDVTKPSRLRNMYLENTMIGYLNRNHFENKLISFREICHQTHIYIMC